MGEAKRKTDGLILPPSVEKGAATPVTPIKDTKKVLPINNDLYNYNLSFFKPEEQAKFRALLPKEIAVDPNVQIQGLRNPLMVFIIGLSTPNVYKNLLRSKKDIRNVIVIESDLQNVNETMKRFPINDFFTQPGVELIFDSGLEFLLPKIFQIFTKADPVWGSRVNRMHSAEIIVDPFIYNTPEKIKEADEIKKIILQAIHQVTLSMGCSDDSFRRWQGLFRVLDIVANSYKSLPLFGKFADVPAIVCGGGPSFEEGLKYIKEYDLANRAIIIACDAVLPKMLASGIKPHIVTRAERKLSQIFNDKAYKEITKEETKDIWYAAYPWTRREFYDLFDKHLMIFRSNGVCMWTGLKPGQVNGGVSAANVALELAYNLGCRDIYMTGIDVAFSPEGRSHTENTRVEIDIERSRNKWIKVKSNNGGEVTTIPIWERCRNEYRQAIVKKERSLSHNVFNTSRNGAYIEGTKVVKWEDLEQNFKITEKSPLGMVNELATPFTDEERSLIPKAHEETARFLKALLSDLRQTFLDYEDMYQTAGAEAEKLRKRLSTEESSRDYFISTGQAFKAIESLQDGCSRIIDNFRNRYFNHPLFRLVLLDILQLNFFNTENAVNQLFNLIDYQFERLYKYNKINYQFLKEVEYYAVQMERELDYASKSGVFKRKASQTQGSSGTPCE